MLSAVPLLLAARWQPAYPARPGLARSEVACSEAKARDAVLRVTVEVSGATYLTSDVVHRPSFRARLRGQFGGWRRSPLSQGLRRPPGDLSGWSGGRTMRRFCAYYSPSQSCRTEVRYHQLCGYCRRRGRLCQGLRAGQG